MKILFTFLFCGFCLFTLSQGDVKMFTEKKSRGYIIYGSNANYCPISISLDLTLQNLKFSEGGKSIFVIPAKTERFKIGELDVVTNAANSFSYKYRSNFGDVSITHYDTAYPYNLPFQKGNKFMIFQGYNGSFSHQNENALDFTMPEGTEIVAAREGVVIQVVQNNTQSCPQIECIKYNNQIMIYHPDGTYAVYAHIRYNGANVKVGDVVKKGDLIAYSGNTGFSSGPHLHFDVRFPNIENKKTIVTMFKIGNGTKVDYLQEKNYYLKDY